MKLDEFSLSLITLTEHIGDPKFYSKLKDLLAEFIYFDELLVLQFNRTANTKLRYRYGVDGNKNNLHGEESWMYLTRLYVLDPFYRIFADKNKFGFFTLDEIAPDEFSSGYTSYFNFLKVSDEIGYLFPVENGNCCHIDITRFGDKGLFSEKEKEILSLLVPPLQYLCCAHIATLDDVNEMTHSNVEQVLVNFGRDILTNKEYQLCQLLLQGHSAKAIATIMEIGYETVKMHKKNVYGKTFLSSQPELLALFIEILQQDSLDPNVDHLALYLAKQ